MVYALHVKWARVRQPACETNSWARTRGAQLSAGYTVNAYSKPLLYDAAALGKPDVDLFIALTDTRHDLPASQSGSTQLKAGNCSLGRRHRYGHYGHGHSTFCQC